MSKQPRPTGEIEPIYDGRIVDLRKEGFELPNGRVVHFEIVRHANAAAILAVDEQDRAILIRQYRQPLDEVIWEVPAGLLESDEEPLVCAKRELREETGYTAKEWTNLGDMLAAPGFCDEVIHLFLARGLELGEQELDENEVLQPQALPLEEVYEMARRGEISDGKSVAALFRAEKLLF